VTPPGPIAAIIVMGVSGSGKSTIAAALADRLRFSYRDGDEFHPRANIEKMRAGTALTDDDRKPWLAAIADAIDRAATTETPLVVACSALKRAYRDVLVHGRADVRLVYLQGTPSLIAERLSARHGHFMPASLLASQFATLEEPGADEPAVTVSIDASVDAIVDQIVQRLRPATKVFSP
jgi:gluconokinase